MTLSACLRWGFPPRKNQAVALILFARKCRTIVGAGREKARQIAGADARRERFTVNSIQAADPDRRRPSLLRRGLTALINAEPDLAVCAEAATQQAGMEAAASSKPDLVIADLSLTGGDGLDLIRAIRASHHGLPILVLTMHDAPFHARRAFTAGASGYVTKQELTETLLLAIRCLLRGETYVSPGLSGPIDTA